MGVRLLSFALALSMVTLSGISNAQDGNNQGNCSSLEQRGFDISPVPMAKLTFNGTDPCTVGLGSYLVNVVGCSDCHSFPKYLPKGDTVGTNPAAGDPFAMPPQQSTSAPLVANYNVLHYLAGGQCFGPFMARNLMPEVGGPYPQYNGLPEGLTEAEFITVMRTGEDIHCEKEPNDPICSLPPVPPPPPAPQPPLQVMPWPNFHNMTDADLQAIYAYLTALPPRAPCNTPFDGCPGFSGNAAATPNKYAYMPTLDGSCPNPAPPQ